MNTLFLPLANALGAPVERFKLICCLFIAYPLGSLFVRIPSSRPNLKHAFNIFVSVFFLIPILGLYWGFIQLLASVLATYFIAANVRSARMPWIVFIFAMGHLTINHIIHVVSGFGYEKVDITSTQMVFTMKLTTFAWNVHDGRRPTKDLDEWQLRKRIVTYPTLLAFLGYAFYFPGFLIGPYIDYTSYASLIDESLFKSVESTKPTRRAIPDGRKRVAYRKMLTGLAFLGFFLSLSPTYKYSLVLTPWFAEQSFFRRFAVFQFIGIIERSKFYGVWILTEGACIMTGFGFTGFGPSGDSRWEGASNIKILHIEFPSNFKGIIDSWNMNANVWLRESVYKRVTPKGKKPGFRSTLITYATSAAWHGIPAGYYLTFVYGSCVTYVARKCRVGFGPLVLPPPGAPSTVTWVKRLYDVLGSFAAISLLTFMAAPFMLLNLADSLKAWSRVGWYGIWVVGCGAIFFNAGGSAYLRRLQQKRGHDKKL